MKTSLRDRWRRAVRSVRTSLWFRPAAYAVLAIAAVLSCSIVEWIDVPLATPIDRGLVSTLLDIITTSMLTVTVFGVGSIVSAYASASNAGTPRVFQLIVADGTSQNATSSFIGAFIFGVIATIGVEANLYDDDGAGLALLGALTVGILVWVIGTFIVWIDNIARLGRVDTSIQKAEAAAARALERASEAPYLGGKRLRTGAANRDAFEVRPTTFGFLSNIDMARLEAIAAELDVTVSVYARPGALIDPSAPIAAIEGVDRDGLAAALAARFDERDDAADGDDEPVSERVDDVGAAVADAEADDSDRDRVEAAIDKLTSRIQAAFDVSDERSFTADPEFSLTVLGEIAAKALSPGINDPGTALSVINALTRQIADWYGRSRDIDEPDYPRVAVPAIETHRLVRAGFDTIVRYGAADADVMRNLLTAFRYLANTADEGGDGKINAYAAAVLGDARTQLVEREYDEIAAACPDRWVDHA